MVILPAQKPGSLVTQAFAHRGPWPSQKDPAQTAAINAVMGFFLFLAVAILILWRIMAYYDKPRHRPRR